VTRNFFQIFPVVCLLMFLTVSCGIKDGPYLPQPVVPKAARGFQVLLRSEGILLEWRAPKKNTDGSPLTNLGGFRIFRAETAFEDICLSCPRDFIPIFDYVYAGPQDRVPAENRLLYTDTDLKYRNMYTYKLQVYNRNNDPGKPAVASDVYWDLPFSAPRKVTAGKSGRLVTISWEPPLTMADGSPAEPFCGYNLYRSEKSGEAGTIPVNEEVFSETAIEDIPPDKNRVYYYTVRAVRKVRDSLVESVASAEAPVSCLDVSPPGIPRGLVAVPVDGGILLKWIPKAEKDFSGFHVYRKERGEKDFVRINDTLLQAATWLDRSVKLKRQYVYTVTSVDASAAANESAFSETAEVYYILK